MGEDVLGVEEEGGAHPGGADEEGQGDGDEFYGEAEGLFLDLGEGLEEGDDQADDGRDGDRDQGEAQDQHEAHLRVVEDLGLAHSRYPRTRPWMRRVQPSTITKRRSLKGREMVTGETIIMPIARRMLETMMSMAMKGR